ARATEIAVRQTETVYVPTGSALDLPAGRAQSAASMRPLLGNGFNPARIYAARSPGVVTIYAFFPSGAAHAAQGSGFVVSPQGYILTSPPVIIDAGESAKHTL